jgi:DNA end-binding protein Ku
MPATVWKGYLSFGLVSFPIRLFAAARPEPIRFHLLHKKDLSRVKEVYYCALEDKPLDRAEIVKGYESGKDEYVVIEPGELKKIAPPTASVMEILQFARMEEIDPILLQNSYYVAPERALSRPYALLLEAMRQTKYNAIAKIAMHGREHVAVLRPSGQGIVLHTMFFVEELHAMSQVKPAAAERFDAKELALAKRLIETLAAPFRPEQYHDEYKRRVQELIEKKQKGQKITPAKQPRKAPVIDIMTALQQSLARTAAASEHAAASAASKRSVRSRKAKTA